MNDEDWLTFVLLGAPLPQERRMQAIEIGSMFNFKFEKSSKVIIEKAVTKQLAIKSKIEERQERISAMKKEHGIGDKEMMELLIQARKEAKNHGSGGKMSYEVRNSAVSATAKGLSEETITVGAGVVNFLLTENDHIESEKDQVKRLMLIIRNLEDLPRSDDKDSRIGGHRLSYDELTYLGF